MIDIKFQNPILNGSSIWNETTVKHPEKAGKMKSQMWYEKA